MIYIKDILRFQTKSTAIPFYGIENGYPKWNTVWQIVRWCILQTDDAKGSLFWIDMIA